MFVYGYPSEHKRVHAWGDLEGEARREAQADSRQMMAESSKLASQVIEALDSDQTADVRLRAADRLLSSQSQGEYAYQAAQVAAFWVLSDHLGHDGTLRPGQLKVGDSASTLEGRQEVAWALSVLADNHNPNTDLIAYGLEVQGSVLSPSEVSRIAERTVENAREWLQERGECLDCEASRRGKSASPSQRAVAITQGVEDMLGRRDG